MSITRNSWLKHYSPSTLAWFYIAVLAAYILIFGHVLLAALSMPDLLIAPIMAVGSFVAGATFLGGGAVAFPALTKILQTDPATAKTFSLAIQSVGMTSASLYIISRVPAIPFKFIALYLIGAVIGLAISLATLQNLFSSADIRISFTLFVLCFFIIYIWTHRNSTDKSEPLSKAETFNLQRIFFTPFSYTLIICSGIVGGLISGLIGSGADLLAFCVLTLFFRLDIRLATQVSVITMACSSILGIAMQAFVFESIPASVKNLWLIAAPVVLFGAPLGAVFCKRTTTRALLGFIAVIVAIEVVSTLAFIPFETAKIGMYALGFCLALVLLYLLFLQSPYHLETTGETDDT